MPSLGDYVGRLLSEITEARLQADLASVRVAEMYASHPLLKHLPVPKFRLPSVTLDVSVAVSGMDESGRQPVHGTFDPGKLRDSVAARFLGSIDRVGVSFAEQGRRSLLESIDQSAKRAAAQPAITSTAASIAEEFVSGLSRLLADEKLMGTRISPEAVKKVTDEVREATRVDILNQATPPSGLKVLVTAAELRSAGPPDLLARLRLSITEEGVEWSVTDQDGKRLERLVPE
jgi:hypothetical protein